MKVIASGDYLTQNFFHLDGCKSKVTAQYLFEEENDLLFEVIAVWPPKAAEVDEAPEAAPNPPPAATEPPPVDDDDSTGGQAGALD